MDSTNYQQALQADVERLKTAHFQILAPRQFYSRVGFIMMRLFMLIVVYPVLLAWVLSGNHYSVGFYIEDCLILTVLFIFMALLFLPQAAQYVTFKETIRPHLMLGDAMDKQFRGYFKGCAIISFIWSTLYTAFFFNSDFSHWGERLLTIVPGMLLGVFFATVLFQMEIARIGLSILFEVLADFKQSKEKAF